MLPGGENPHDPTSTTERKPHTYRLSIGTISMTVNDHNTLSFFSGALYVELNDDRPIPSAAET